MKYKLRGPYKESLIDTILSNRGIEDVEKFLNPTLEKPLNLLEMTNMKKGIELLHNSLNKKIIVLVDSDVDGFTSATLMYKYIKELDDNVDIDYYVHGGKMHGLTKEFMNFIELKKAELIIIPDAGSNDVDEIQALEEKGINVLILDHHKIDKKTDYGVIINNQHCDKMNPNFTGVGVAYLFVKAYNEYYNKDIDISKLEDLLLIGSVGDGANIVEEEVRFFCERARKNINNNLIKTFYEDKNKDLDKIAYSDLSFGGIIPAINSIIRAGTLEEKKLVFKALCDINSDYTEVVEKRKLNKTTRKYEMVPFELNIYQLAIEACSKAKARQDKILKKKTEELLKQYTGDSIGIFLMEEDEEIKSITGVLANKLASAIRVPALVMWKNADNFLIGSGRGNIDVILDLKKWCLDTELFELAQGHANAFGLILDEKNLEKVKEFAKEIEKTEEYCYEVDLEYNGIIKKQHFYIVDSYRELWCNGCEEPLLAVKNLPVKKSDISLRGSILKIYANNTTFIKYKTTEEEYKKIVANGFFDTLDFTIVGRFSINEYGGNRYPQVIIEAYDYKIKDNLTINNFFD